MNIRGNAIKHDLPALSVQREQSRHFAFAIVSSFMKIYFDDG